MKTFSMLSLTFGVALTVSSCNNTSGGKATPIDESNDNGKAPVEYTSGQPDNKLDTTMHSQPLDQKARQDNSANRSMDNNTTPDEGADKSNTDNATTPGSANSKKGGK